VSLFKKFFKREDRLKESKDIPKQSIETQDVEVNTETNTETNIETNIELNTEINEIIQDAINEEEKKPVWNENSTQVLQEQNLSESPDTSVKETKKEGFVKKLFAGLSKTRDNILKGVDEVLSAFKHIDEDLYEELEEVLIMADFGMETTTSIIEQLRQVVKQKKINEPNQLKEALQDIISSLLTREKYEPVVSDTQPTVILVIGVNGAGKTTSIGKLAYLFKQNNKKVLLAAADTFRAAAIEQLQIWANRASVDLIRHEEGSDAAAVVFDAISAAKSRRSDVLICDTAGRLQNKTNLMKELEKISRIIEREYPEAKKEILIVLDATTGQNALQQVKLFKEVANINGIILTKLDGTAKGGAIVSIHSSLKVPVKYIGVGETIEDLQPFDAEAFAKALFKEK
jgi:fused signal recognition particle receptor